MSNPKARSPLCTLGALALAGVLGSCVTTDKPDSGSEKARDFWSFFETGELGADGGPESPYDSDSARSVPGLLGSNSTSTEFAAPEPDPPQIAVNWYSEFGKQIMVREAPDPISGELATYITKPFRMPMGRAQKVLDLMKYYGEFVLTTLPDGLESASGLLPTWGEVEAVVLAGWDQENYGNLRNWPPAPMSPTSIGDRLLITCQADLMYDVEDFINLFMAEVPQIEIEAKIIEVNESDELYVGISPSGDNPIFGFPDGTFVDSLDYTFPSAATASEALLTVSGIHDGLAFNAVLEAVAALESVEVDSRPKIVVRDGGVASIEGTEDVPFYSFSGINGSTSNFNATLTFKEVGIKLYVSPRIVGSNTIVLFVEVESSSESGSLVTFVTDTGGTLSTPRITKQVAKTTVYLEPGQAVIIGGLTTEKTVTTERKIPLLGDIPFLGRLFRSDGTRKVRSHTLFYISPRILQGIDRSYKL
jgi:type II secretory pathway component GspD/PulD (secretin)